MDPQRKSLQIGAAVIGTAVALRLLSGGALAPLARALTRPETVAVLMYLETGRVTRPYNAMTYPAESPVPEWSQPPPKDAPVFTAADADTVELDNETGYEPDIGALLTAPLNWDLEADHPTVLILHTHGTESYTPSPGEDYEESSAYRTMDENYNMISVGSLVADRLETAGIQVIHDRSFHDYPSYNGSYTNARASIEEILAENSGIRLILDLHRDAAAVGNGQMDTSATVNGRESAQLMLVIGTDDGGLYHPGWEENLALAVKLQALLEQTHPGLCRPLNLCAERFNGDTSPGALLVEVGAAGNTRDEAMLAAEALADGIIALVNGANLTEDSTN